MDEITKPCRGCGKELPLGSFYTHPQMGDGHLNFCKECVKARVTAHRNRNVEKIRAYDLSRAKLPHRKALMARITERIAKAFPEKKQASLCVNNAVRDGRLDKPEHCEMCGCKPSRLYGHHGDYSKPLEVLWVCQPCHARIHAQLKEAQVA